VKALSGATVAVSAGVAGFAKLSQSALDAVGDFEQLKGGIETLFGAQGAQSVQEYARLVGKSVDEVQDEYNSLMETQAAALENADKAYKTAGLSANAYMETVTSFAASLKQSLGDDKAWQLADYADKAVIDMSDNANKMGTDMESIQNAYQGFAKQNYTMLDNLKLGYGGTKEEMERLLKDAEKLAGYKAGTFDISSFADIVDAIHIVQDELGITGTTAKEAATTIQGSVGAMKASWENFLAGSGSVSELVDSVITATDVIVDNLGDIIPRLAEGIPELAEKLGDMLPEQFQKLLPPIMKGATSLIQGLVKSLPPLIQTLLPSLIEGATALIGTLLEELPSILGALEEVIPLIIEAVMTMLPQLMDAGLQIILQLAFGIAQSLPALVPQIVDVIFTIVEVLLDNIDLLIDAGIELLIGLAVGLVEAAPLLVEKIPVIIEKLVDAVVNNGPKLLEAVMQLAEMTVKMLPDIIKAIIDGLVSLATNLWDKVLYPAHMKFVEWSSGIVEKGKQAAGEFIEKVIEFIKELPENIAYWLGFVIAKVWKWSTEFSQKAAAAGLDFVSKIVQFLQSLPSKVMEWLNNVITKVVSFRLQLGNKAKDAGSNFCEKILNSLKNLPNKMAEVGKNLVSGIWNGLSSGWSWLVDSVKGLAESLFEGAKDALGIHSPSRKFKWIGEMCVAGMDEPLEQYDPYDTLNKSMELNTGAFRAEFAGAYTERQAAGLSIDYGRMGQEMKNAVNGMSVSMDGRKVGQMVAEPVNAELGRINIRRT